ncbi:NAD(+) diphosphatase [Hathewaya massiliensis]|uniref:NAD(+) diphosphatase n=1 Tax=Hathewaya massiliensis TaxID=1964382 RepID=UPI00115A45EE|nr:NUDIX domain-containing protein [Hathewaya massiliensis]
MKYKFCPICGSELVEKYSWDEGYVPYCKRDELLFFDIPKPCVVVAVIKDDEVLLLKQDYIYENSEVLVSGYVSQSETVEDTVYREVEEETGIKVRDIEYLGSQYIENKELLMLTFIAFYEGGEITTSREVGSASWRKLENAIDYMEEDCIGKNVIRKALEKVSSK